MISNKYSTRIISVKRATKATIQRPEVVQQYIMNYSTIDKLDQLMHYIRFPHRCTKWTTAIFMYSLQICILQAFHLFKMLTKRTLGIKDFVKLLMIELAKLTRGGQEAAKIEEIISTILDDHIKVNYRVYYPKRTGKHELQRLQQRYRSNVLLRRRFMSKMLRKTFTKNSAIGIHERKVISRSVYGTFIYIIVIQYLIRTLENIFKIASGYIRVKSSK